MNIKVYNIIYYQKFFNMYIEFIRKQYKVEIMYFGPMYKQFSRFGVEKAQFISKLYLIVYKNIQNESDKFACCEPDYIEEEMDEPEANQHLLLFKTKREIKVQYENINEFESVNVVKQIDTILRDKLKDKSVLKTYLQQESDDIDEALDDTFFDSFSTNLLELVS